MGLFEKIEEIRKKPEHIRLRYVWFFVIICMILIITLWFFSITTDIADLAEKNKEKRSSQQLEDIKNSGSDLFENIKEQTQITEEAQKKLYEQEQ